MSSSNAKAKQGSRWGSLLSGAVSGLESRLDTILGDDPEASAKSRALDKAQQDGKAGQPGTGVPGLAPPRGSADLSRSSSRSRVNDRLQERLAKAVTTSKQGSQAGSEAPSRTASPLIGAESPRASLGSRPSVDVPRDEVETDGAQAGEEVESIQADDVAHVKPVPEPTGTLLTSGLPINPARLSLDTASRSSLEISDEPVLVVEQPETNGTPVSARTTAELEAEVEQMRSDHAESEMQRQEEMHANMERIDALQAKLQYLAKETVAAAKEVNAGSAGGLEQRVAEKDERIALLMEEGEKLSKTEMRHLATIRKMRAKSVEEEKSSAVLRSRVASLEQSDVELKQKLKRSEQAVKQHIERLKRVPKLESDMQTMKVELDTNKVTIATLRRQLAEAEARAEDAQVEAKRATSQMDSKKMSELQDGLADAKLEKRLADDRAKAEARRTAEIAVRDKERSQALETELRNEIANMESRMETLRFRAEEASSDSAGDSQAKLLRQIETLQTQYSLAAENWRTIEGSLNARVTAIEKERDEATKRENDIRKKARDVNSKSRKTEEELEAAAEQARSLTDQLREQRAEVKKLQSRVDASEKALEEARVDFERQRRLREAEILQRLEEERSRVSQQGSGNKPLISRKHSGTESPTSNRKFSAVEPRRGINRVFSNDSSLFTDRQISRNSSAMYPVGRTAGTPDLGSPTMSRQHSTLSFANVNGMSGDMPTTPSIMTHDFDGEDAFEHPSSPQQTANDVISASTVHTGPSVQLVERMSSSIRKLESEKASHKEELLRLLTQRDEARNEVVALMRESDSSRGSSEKADRLEKEVSEIKSRYDACLEMLGEREEEVQELKGDISDLKEMYRALADKMGR